MFFADVSGPERDGIVLPDIKDCCSPLRQELHSVPKSGLDSRRVSLQGAGVISGDIPWTVARLRAVAENPCGPPQTQLEIGLQSLWDSIECLTERYPSLRRPPLSHTLSALHLSLQEVKSQTKTETKRYSEIFRDFDNLELTLIQGTVEDLLQDPDNSQSIGETVSTETTENTELDEITSEDGFCAELRSEGDEKDGTFSAQMIQRAREGEEERKDQECENSCSKRNENPVKASLSRQGWPSGRSLHKWVEPLQFGGMFLVDVVNTVAVQSHLRLGITESDTV
ncbi:hypothetical protein JZ751_027491 [Albula glossodonta]|uniref:Uncharacterized protein n=1 Tax=Albula glossodonta TaxID=121402 RepID=A0A8T2NEV3_9TELE|nr:hypothetical protein JZ751_027491 [Albula glossodonta]